MQHTTIPADGTPLQTSPERPASWKRALAAAIRDPDELLDALGLPDSLRPAARRAARLFPLVAPRGFVRRMERRNPDDPLLRQVLPLDLEEAAVEGFTADPLAESTATRRPGLLEKYSGRALLIAAGACAINCRYCFRRHFPYEEAPRSLAAWEPALEAIERDRSIREVILSGGDPLVLTDESLSRLVRRLDAIPHLRRLRIHSRLPVVIPERVDEALLAWLAATRLTPVLVIHANHPREIDADCEAAFLRLVRGGIPVLNQSVLLRGVNDDAETLAELSERLIDCRVLPYYLHQLDAVAGAAHFHVSEDEGREIVTELRRRLPGYAVPRYVREEPGAAWKTEV